MKRLIVVALVLATVACTSVYDPAILDDDSYAPTYVQLEGDVVAIEIADARRDTTSRELRIPGMSFPWNDDAVEPTVTAADRAFIETEIRKYFTGGESARVRVQIVRAVKRFRANWFSEGEEAECELVIELSRGEDQRRRCRHIGSATVKITSFDAGRSKIDAIYRKVIAASLQGCFAECAEHAGEGELLGS